MGLNYLFFDLNKIHVGILHGYISILPHNFKLRVNSLLLMNHHVRGRRIIIARRRTSQHFIYRWKVWGDQARRMGISHWVTFTNCEGQNQEIPKTFAVWFVKSREGLPHLSNLFAYLNVIPCIFRSSPMALISTFASVRWLSNLSCCVM